MIEIEAALNLIYARFPQQNKVETISIHDAVGRVAAEAIVAQLSIPPFPRAGMDGYAVMAEDTFGASSSEPVTLTVVETLFAGDPVNLKGKRGTAVRIMTGSEIPEGYDSVIQQEWTDQGRKQVRLFNEIDKGRNYGPVGEDVAVNQLLISRYQRLNSRAVGVLAAQGITRVSVLKPLKVGIIATGSELVPIGVPLTASKIYNSNLATIGSFVKASGSQLMFQKQCPDSVSQISDLIRRRIEEVDLLITTGGVSVGARDYLPEVIQGLASPLFHGVNMQPGTPLMASFFRDRLILSVSGQPFASMVSLHLFYWSVLAHFMNCPALNVEKRTVRLREDLPMANNRRFKRGFEKDGWVTIGDQHFSSVFHNTLETNCLVEQWPQQQLVKGDEVTVYYWQE